MTTYNLGTVVGENGEDGRGIRCIQKTGTSGLVDTYTIYYTDDTTTTYEVTNGEGGADIVTAWESTLSDTKVPSEKLTKNTLDTKQATLVSGTNIKTINNNSILGSGNIDIQGTGVDIDTSFPSTPSDTHVPSTKLVKNTVDTKISKSQTAGLVKNDGTIDTSAYITSSALSNYIQKSSTSGLIKNDGTIDTSAYITSSALSNYVQKSSTSGLIKNDGSIDTNTYVDTDDIANNLTTTTSGKVLDARQGKALADLIGDAIDYINL